MGRILLEWEWHCIFRGFRWELFPRRITLCAANTWCQHRIKQQVGTEQKAQKKTANMKCQQIEEYHPVCLSHCGVSWKKMTRGAFKACASWQEEQQRIKEEKKKRDGSRKRKIGLSTKKDGGEKRRQGVGGSSSDRAHLQLSQIISAREVRGGEMSKYLNKFHRSLLRVGRCGERGIVGANGVERGWEGWGI